MLINNRGGWFNREILKNEKNIEILIPKYEKIVAGFGPAIRLLRWEVVEGDADYIAARGIAVHSRSARVRTACRRCRRQRFAPGLARVN